MSTDTDDKLIDIGQMKGFGERLILARQCRGWRQVDLARIANLGTQTVYRLEKKAYPPARRTLQKLVEVLQVSPLWLEHGVGAGPDASGAKRIVEEYLASPEGQDTPPEVATVLRRTNFSDWLIDHVDKIAIRRVRQTLETNLLLGRQQRDNGDDGG